MWKRSPLVAVLTTGCIGSCFPAGVRLSTPKGRIAIEDIEVDDLVWSVDVSTGRLVERTVARRLAAMATELMSLTFFDGTQVQCTPEHPIYEASGETWIPAGQLRLEHRVVRLINGDLVEMRVERIERQAQVEPIEVFDLTIGGGPEHNFIAGGILVHNKSFVSDGFFGDTAFFGDVPDDPIEDEEQGLTTVAGSFTQADLSDGHLCAVSDVGETQCWGNDSHGQLQVPEGLDAIAVATGGYFSCAIDVGGLVSCWGDNSSGQLEPPEGQFTFIDAGVDHACGIHDDGTVACWGAGQSDEGIWPNLGQAAPPEGQFLDVAAGALFTCGLDLAGAVKCWGLSDHQVSGPWTGYGGATLPTGAFTTITASNEYACASTNLESACWGATPRAIGGEGSGVDLSAAPEHICWLDDEWMLGCAGNDQQGQAEVPNLYTYTPVLAVVTGGFASCVINASTRDLSCWGAHPL